MYRYMLTSFLLIVTTSLAQAGIQVGCLTSTQRVLRDELPPTGRAVELQAAKNECRSFQILLRSDSPAKIISVEASDLQGPRGSVIPASAAGLYREHQFHITEASYRNASFKPGWYPDALIPFVDPVSHKPLTVARFSAVPFDLPANETHGFWVDIFVPGNTPAGRYTDRYTINLANQNRIVIPVTLTVWDFKLPDTPTLVTCFGSPTGRVRERYTEQQKPGMKSTPPDWDAVNRQCSEMLAENKFNAAPMLLVEPVQQSDGSYVVPSDQVAELRRFIDRYHINLYLVHHPQEYFKDPVQEKDRLQAWLKAWDKAYAELNRPKVTFCIYLSDEPDSQEKYQYAQKWGKAIRAAHSVVKVLVVRQTKTDNPAWGDLYGAVDIWCPMFPDIDDKLDAERQAHGEEIWTYTALCQENPTPWWQTDFPLLNYRVSTWMAWKSRMTGLLYWGGMCYWADVIDDPWTKPKTYVMKSDPKITYNGEGTLLYPAEDVGYAGFAPSMRMKAIRDSIQDFEYLAILDRAGKTAAAQRVVSPLTESWFKWNENPEAYDKARIALAKLILSKP